MLRALFVGTRSIVLVLADGDEDLKYRIKLGTELQPDIRKGQKVTFQNLAPATSYDVSVAVAAQACKFIRIVNNDQGDPLSLAEVRALNVSGKNAANPKNGGTAKQTSTLYGGQASRAIDGRTSGDWGGNSVTHTDAGKGQFWQVDIKPQVIKSVAIFNRTDCCSDRLKGALLAMYGTDNEVFFTQRLTGDVTQQIFIPPEGMK